MPLTTRHFGTRDWYMRLSSTRSDAAKKYSSIIIPKTDNVSQPVDTCSPHANHAALQLCKSLTKEDYDELVFEDELVFVARTGQELGQFSLSVKPSRFNDEECLYVSAASNGCVDHVPCGTGISAHVTYQLVTLQHQQIEFVKPNHNCMIERKIKLEVKDDQMDVSMVTHQGAESNEVSSKFKLIDLEGFITEASCFLLQRLLVKKGFKDSLHFLGIDRDGKLCKTIYKPLGDDVMTIGGAEYPVIGIEKAVLSTDAELSSVWQMYFLKDGHMASRNQTDSLITMKINTVPMSAMEEELRPKPTFEKVPLQWDKDLQLHSEYLQRKEELLASHQSFLRHNPEVEALMADFLQSILLHKPDDTIKFAARYFSRFAKNFPADPHFRTSEELQHFPHNRMDATTRYLAKCQHLY